MRKVYLFILVFMSALFMGSLTVQADDVTFEVNANTGFWTDWNNNAGNPWAKTWESTQDDPHITIHQASNANNMRFWDGTNITFFNSVGGRTQQENYDISVSSGWYITGVSFDFSCANEAGVSISMFGGDPIENWSQTDFEHAEITGLQEEVVSFTVATLTQGTTTFAQTKNFIITLTQQTGIEKAWSEFLATLSKYEVYDDAAQFPVGTNPGDYDAAAVEAFFAALRAAQNVDELDNVTEETLQQLSQSLVDTYDAMIASRNMGVGITSGYYRFRAAMEYNDGLPKYMFSLTASDGAYYGYWATPEEGDAFDAIQSLWKVTATDGLYDIVNVWNNARFTGPTAASGYATMSTESTELMAIDPAGTVDGLTYLNIRLSSKEAGNYFYLHQGSHGGGAGTGGFVVGWCSTIADGVPAASEWLFEAVDESEVQQIQAAYEAAKARSDFEDQYRELLAAATADLVSAEADMQATPLITDAGQFSSPWSDSDEGLDFGALIDEDPSTYWHTDWHNGNQPNHTHFLQVALNEPAHELVRLTITRRAVANDHVTQWGVYGSNAPDAEDDAWTLLAVLTTPFGNNTETVSGLAFDTKGFQHLRFYIDGTTSNRGYGHVSEFQLYEVVANAESQFAAIGQEAQALSTTVLTQSLIPVSDITTENYAELENAYKAFKGKFVDPVELRGVLAESEAVVAGFVVGSNPGCWSDASAADALKQTLAAAQAYDAGGVYVAGTTTGYVSTLKAQMEALIASANTISTDKWYRIRFGTEEEFERYGWDPVAGEGTETDEPLFGKFMTVAEYEDGAIFSTEADLVRLGNQIFFDEEADIEDADLAKFRFVAVGDSAFLLQNKATGLFLKAAGASGAVTLDIHPSLFNVSAIGFGQNLIAATDLKGNNQNYLHAQVLYNLLVTWNATTPGSRSALFIEEAGDLESSYQGEEFFMDLRAGQIYPFCYPVDLRLGNENEGQMYTVAKVEGTSVTLSPIADAFPGRPFIYINGETEDYVADDDPVSLSFLHGYSFVAEPQTDAALKGTFTALTPGAGYIIVDDNSKNAFTVSRPMMENSSVPAHGAYIASDVALSVGDAITIEISTEEDGIQSALSSVTRSGAIYTLDGLKVAEKGNLNTLKNLGRGVYILNGTKVTVK